VLIVSAILIMKWPWSHDAGRGHIAAIFRGQKPQNRVSGWVGLVAEISIDNFASMPLAKG